MQPTLTVPTRLLRDADAYFDAYPCAARLGDGNLLVVFSRSLPATTPGERTAAAIWGVRSSDNGITWSDPFPLIDTAGRFDYDPNLISWDNKVMVIATTVPTLHSHQVTTSQFIAIRSEDCGCTWSASFEIPFPYVYCSGKINPGVHLPDGTLVFGFCADIKLQEGGQVWQDRDSWGESGVMISTDDGHTWTPGQTIGVREERPADAHLGAINGLDEPALAVGGDGVLYMLMRSGFDRLFASRSHDQGRTWGQPQRSPLMAHNAPADLCVVDHPRLGRGWLVIYDHSPRDRFPLAVAVSFNEGKTWSTSLILTGLGENVAYPACVQTPAGPVLLVWQRDFQLNALDPAGGQCRAGREIQSCQLGLDQIDHLLD